MKSTEIGELIKALVSAQAEYKPIVRDSVNPYYKSKYATLDAVIDATAPALRKNGLVVIQTTRENYLVTTLAHTSGQYISGEYPLSPVKTDPQGIGSALTYARRYAYCAIVQCAPSDEDNDGNDHAKAPVPDRKKETSMKISDAIDLLEKATEMKSVLNYIAQFKAMPHWSEEDKKQINEAYKLVTQKLKGE